MRRMLLTVLAVATFVSSGLLLHRAVVRALPIAAARTSDAGPFRVAANVCSLGGCVSVQVQRLDKHQLQKNQPKTLQQYMQQEIPVQQQVQPQPQHAAS